MIADILNSGFEGIPISYSPRTDDVIALTLLACFFLSSIALARGKKFLTQQVKDFVLHRERTSIFDSSTAADVRYLLVLKSDFFAIINNSTSISLLLTASFFRFSLLDDFSIFQFPKATGCSLHICQCIMCIGKITAEQYLV